VKITEVASIIGLLFSMIKAMYLGINFYKNGLHFGLLFSTIKAMYVCINFYKNRRHFGATAIH
jgi:hypothetical protein